MQRATGLASSRIPPMAVTIICPNLKCRAMLQVSDKSRGKKVRCSQCDTAFLIPPKQQVPADQQPTPQSN